MSVYVSRSALTFGFPSAFVCFCSCVCYRLRPCWLILQRACVLFFFVRFCIWSYSSSGVSGPAVVIAQAAVLATVPVAVLIVAAAIALACCYVTLLLLLLHAFPLQLLQLLPDDKPFQGLSKALRLAAPSLGSNAFTLL